MNYATIENHMISPAADDEAYFNSLDRSEYSYETNREVETFDDTTPVLWCEVCKHDVEDGQGVETAFGWVHHKCIEVGRDREPIAPHPSLPVMPDTATARNWKKRAMEVMK